MKRQLKKVFNIIMALVILVSSTGVYSINVKAAYTGEKKYTMQQCINIAKKAPMLSNMKLYHDSHGYYAVYRYNGRVECFLGKTNQKMYFSDFVKKLNGSTSKKVKTFTVTKTERELKKIVVGALVSYLCTQAGCPWYASYVIGYGGDKGVDAILRKPGKYRMTTVSSKIKAYDCASRGYMETYTYYSVSKLEKYNKSTKRWDVVWKISNPKFII